MCGIIGIIGQGPVSDSLFQAMLHLQHRGQDASGIYLYSPSSQTPFLKKRHGLVQNLFLKDEGSFMEGEWGLGHVRYATAGKNCPSDAQPHVHGKLALVHNGNLVNYLSLKRRLEPSCTFQTGCDSEALLYQLFQNLACPNFDGICSAVASIFAEATGSYSVIALLEGVGMFAFRDPHGIRPLVMGAQPFSYAFASETSALSVLGYRQIEDLQPGEVVFVDQEGTLHRRRLCTRKKAFCSFEFNYFAKPHSLLEGKEIYQTRAKLGKSLAQRILEARLTFDAIVPIPESGNVAAASLAQALSIPFETGFVKMGHVRTFLCATAEKRETAVKQKLFSIASVFEGKSVLLVDDSIIRGTVSKRAIALAKEAGAKSVSIASTFPPVRFPCVYGIDFPNQEDLIAANKSIEEIEEALGADKVIYNSVGDFKEAIGMEHLCTGCMTGSYPTSLEGIEELQRQRKEDLQLIGT